jgi:hypothetical protein
VLLELTWDAYASVNDYSFTAVSGTVLWGGRVSPGWLGAGTSYSYRQPDLAGVAGWSSSWSVVTTKQVPANPAWSVNANTSPRGLSGVQFENNLVPPATALDGLVVRSAQAFGAFVVPPP